MAKIILKSQFTVSSKKSLFNFVDYVTRSQALKDKKEEKKLSDQEQKELEKLTNVLTESEFSIDDVYSDYVDYMKREQAILSKDDTYLKGVFSSSKRKIAKEDVTQLKKEIEDITVASKKGSVMFQDVISFENDFLVEENILNEKTNELDEERLYNATEKMMSSLKENENLHDTFWFASVHRNTDNIHLHICSMEKNNTRQLKEFEDGHVEVKGKRKQQTLDKMKMSFGRELTSPEYRLKLQTEMTNSRNQLLKDLKQIYEKEIFSDTPKLIKKISLFKKDLPDKKFNWQYGKLDATAQKELNEITSMLTKDSPERKKFDTNVTDYALYLKGLYGDSAKPEEYINNKKKEMETRLGNSLLNDLKKDSSVIDYKMKSEIESVLLEKPKKNPSKNQLQQPKKKIRTEVKSPYTYRKNMQTIKRNLIHDYDMKRAENEYEQTQFRIEQEKQRQAYSHNF